MTVGERIKLFRKFHNITQKNLALRLGISQTHISKIENNEDKPSENLIHLIASICSIDYNWLAFGEGEMNVKRNDKSEYTLNQCLCELQNFEKNKDSNDFKNLLNQIAQLIDLYYQADKFEHFKYFDSCYISSVLSALKQSITYLTVIDKKYGGLPELSMDNKECRELEETIYDQYGYYLDEILPVMQQYLIQLLASWKVMQKYIDDSYEMGKKQ